MRCKVSEWFEVKFAYNKTMEDGAQKLVTELYVVEALSFTEAEAKIIEEMEPYVQDGYNIKAIARPQYKEVWFSDKNTDDKWYKARFQFITFMEKKTNMFYLIQAGSFDAAKKYVENVMRGTMKDYTVTALKETSVMEAFEVKNQAK